MRKRVFVHIISILLFLASCTSSRATPNTQLPSQQPSAAFPSTSPTINIIRKATFSEISDEVEARLGISYSYRPATNGQEIPTGGQARTGEPGKARVDLSPDNSIIRLGPKSEFTLRELGNEPQSLFTKIQLSAGQLWIILMGGELQVETELGTASVRGSFMGIYYDPEKQIMTLTCLEGSCSLENNFGRTNLTDTQASDILNPSNPPTPTRPLSENEYSQWVDNNPEAGGLPGPQVYGIPPVLLSPMIDPDLSWPSGSEKFSINYLDPSGDTSNCISEESIIDPATDILSSYISDQKDGVLTIDVIVDKYEESTYYVYVTFYWLTDPLGFADYLAEISPDGINLIKQVIPGEEISFGNDEDFITGQNAKGNRVFRFIVEKKALSVDSLIVSLYHIRDSEQVCDHQTVSPP